MGGVGGGAKVGHGMASYLDHMTIMTCKDSYMGAIHAASSAGGEVGVVICSAHWLIIGGITHAMRVTE